MIEAKASTRATLLGLVLLVVGTGCQLKVVRQPRSNLNERDWQQAPLKQQEPDPGPMQGEWMGHLMQEGYASPATSMGILPKECPGPPAGYHMKQLPSGQFVYRPDQ